MRFFILIYQGEILPQYSDDQVSQYLTKSSFFERAERENHYLFGS